MMQYMLMIHEDESVYAGPDGEAILADTLTKHMALAEALVAAGVPFSRAPGMAFEYSNFGYALLGRIIANVSGMPYRRYVEQSLLTPLGMASSGYQVSEWPVARRSLGYRWEDGRWKREPDMADGAFGAMGGLQTSANDYARWVAFLLSAWPPRDDAESGPVSRASVRMLAEGSNFMSVGQRNGKSGATACRQAAPACITWRPSAEATSNGSLTVSQCGTKVPEMMELARPGCSARSRSPFTCSKAMPASARSSRSGFASV